MEAEKQIYIFKENQQDHEHFRLQLIESALDESTIANLREVDIQKGWNCLEIGAGAGSIASWLGGSVGENGSVVSIDKNIKYLGHLKSPVHQVHEQDLMQFELQQHFDFIHARYVLIHNTDHDGLLRRIYAMLKPGGFIVLEEPDFTSAKTITNIGRQHQERVNRAICKMFHGFELDPEFGAKLPSCIQQTGFDIRKVHAIEHLCHGGAPVAKVMAESAIALEEKYLATGEADALDIEGFIQNANNPEFWANYYTTVSVIAVKPYGSW